jgi:hypothetical protein
MRALLRVFACLSMMTVAASADGPAVTPNLPVIKATPAMWTVHGPKGLAYLFGSMHALPRDVDWMTPQVTQAMTQADSFVFEVPMDLDYRKMAGRMLAQSELLPISTSLPSMFDSQMRADFRAAVANTHVVPEVLVMMRPWRAAELLADAMSGDVPIYASEGVDNKVFALASARGVTDFRSFETVDFQLHVMMGDATPENELSVLRTTMHEASARKIAPFGNLLLAWENGDVKAIAAADADQGAQKQKAILDDRNVAWVPKIEKMLKERRTFFITVGAGHLAGPNGVPNLLRAAGYKVDGP